MPFSEDFNKFLNVADIFGMKIENFIFKVAIHHIEVISMEGPRSRGRPKKRWMDSVKEDKHVKGEDCTLIADRRHVLCPPHIIWEIVEKTKKLFPFHRSIRVQL